MHVSKCTLCSVITKQALEVEVKSKSQEYEFFVKGGGGGGGTSAEDNCSAISASVGGQESAMEESALMQCGNKCVKFNDEDTLERNIRKKTIQRESGDEVKPQAHGVSSVSGVSGISGVSGVSGVSSVSGVNDISSVSGSGLLLPSSNDTQRMSRSSETLDLLSVSSTVPPRPQSPGRSRSCSPSPNHSQSPAPLPLLPRELQQLLASWNEVSSCLGRQGRRLKMIQDVWGAFEAKREDVAFFLSNSEGLMGQLLSTLETTKDLSLVQVELARYKVCAIRRHMT